MLVVYLFFLVENEIVLYLDHILKAYHCHFLIIIEVIQYPFHFVIFVECFHLMIMILMFLIDFFVCFIIFVALISVIFIFSFSFLEFTSLEYEITFFYDFEELYFKYIIFHVFLLILSKSVLGYFCFTSFLLHLPQERR